MKKVERQEQQILDVLKISQKMGLAEAMELLQVSESTARRLFIRLESAGKVFRNYGGIQLVSDTMMDYSYEQVENRCVEQKKAIAAAAAAMVEEGDMVYLDSGTTLAHVSMELAGRMERGELKAVTVFTNSLMNLNILHKTVRVNLIGGEYREHRKDFCGYIAEETVKSLHFTKSFLGADGYNIQNGFTATDFYTARLNEGILQNADLSYIVMDSSKFLTSSIVSYTRAKPADGVITDSMPGEEIAGRLAEQGIRLILANVPETAAE